MPYVPNEQDEKMEKAAAEGAAAYADKQPLRKNPHIALNASFAWDQGWVRACVGSHAVTAAPYPPQRRRRTDEHDDHHRSAEFHQEAHPPMGDEV